MGVLLEEEGWADSIAAGESGTFVRPGRETLLPLVPLPLVAIRLIETCVRMSVVIPN